MVIGLGAGGATGLVDGLRGGVGLGGGVRLRRGAGCAGATGWAGAATPTTMSRISSTLPMTPIVETGVFVPSPWTWPDGKVRLFAVRTPDDLRLRHVRLGELRRVERDRDLLLVAAA